MQAKVSVRGMFTNFLAYWTHWLLAALVVFLFVYPFIGSATYMYLITEIFILGLAAMSVNLLLGYSGLLTFGHAGLFACGAYTFAIMAKYTSLPFALNLVCTLLVPIIVAAIIGYFCVRTIAFSFAMLTLCFGMLIYTFVWKMYGITGGEDGCIGWYDKIPGAFASPEGGYFFTLTIVSLCILFLWRLVNSPFGWILRASRENRLRVEAIGINIRRYQLVNFIISGLVIGIAGMLFAILQRGAYPEFAYWIKSGDFVMMCLLGGMFNFIGPIVGAAIIIAIEFWVLKVTENWPLIMGTIFLFCVLFLRGGIVGFVSERIRQQSKK